MSHHDAAHHVRGTSRFVDDAPGPADMLHAAVVGSRVAAGELRGVDPSAALALPGVHSILVAADVPGENQIGAILPDEPLLADGEVDFIGQPVALVLAADAATARHAASLVVVHADARPPVVDPREAFLRGELLAPARTFAKGDVEHGFAVSDVVVSGRCDLGGQEHLYLETQRARAVPGEGGAVVVSSSTQSPWAVQKAVARVLGKPAHLVEVDVPRLGGGFGGKEDQATAWACLAALGVHVTGRAVQLVLDRVDDLQMTGKRHPYSADFRMGVRHDGTILAFEAMLFQNSGAHADLSTAVLERSLFHATNAYRIPHSKVTAACCRTNLQPHTAFRGFGGPQGMFVVESAIAAAAEAVGLPRHVVQRRNLLREGDVFAYGQRAERVRAEQTWEDAVARADLDGLLAEVDAHNARRGPTRRGVAVMPICFGIAFTKTFMNQAGALVHVYADGSVAVSTGGVEMGQGVSSKIRDLTSEALGVRSDRIRVLSTNTTRVANMSPSAASATADLNGHAVLDAIARLRDRLRGVAATGLGVDPSRVGVGEQVTVDGTPRWTWEKLVSSAYLSRVDLSEHGFYATPGLHFDPATEKGHPFGYHVYGTCIVAATVDCIRGTYRFDRVIVSHDLGRSINPVVDVGQIEGALAQGLGWMTIEDLVYDDQGRLRSNALSTYKAPDVDFMPAIELSLVEEPNPVAPRGSKAVGEPPLMYGIAAYFALREAIRAFGGEVGFHVPMTPERVLLALYR